MKRLFRWALIGAAVVSAALCIATVVLLARSNGYSEQWSIEYWSTPGKDWIVSRSLGLESANRSLNLMWARYDHHAFTSVRNYASQPVPGGLPKDGLHVFHSRERSSEHPAQSFELNLTPAVLNTFQSNSESRNMRAPHWFVIVLTGGTALVFLRGLGRLGRPPVKNRWG
jgi:hypothetical protein